MDRLLIVGLDPEETAALKSRLDLPTIAWPTLPRIKLEHGQLYAERHGAAGHFLPVTKVLYHGIFGDDFDFITALALWAGPCLPSAQGMLDCRLRLPCLARALRVTRFNSTPRGYGDHGTSIAVGGPSVAKWGNWHCGENKEKFAGHWICTDPTVIEPFIEGQAVRVMLIGDRSWQISLASDDWRKSIHPADAAIAGDVRPDLLADARSLADHFGLELAGIDYVIATDGTPHLLEVNHIPNVTRFPEIRAEYLDYAARWVGAPSSFAAL